MENNEITNENKEKKPKVLITYIESGMGHIIAAQTISDALDRDKLDVVESNIMKDYNNKSAINFEKFLISQTKNTGIPGFGFFMFNFVLIFGGRQKSLQFCHSTFFRAGTLATIDAIVKENPDVIISTHHFITYCAVVAKRKYLPNLKIITYVPDNYIHMWWDKRDGVLICNNPDTVAMANKLKYKDVREVEFPVRKIVKEQNLSRIECRKKYGIPENDFVVMVADSAYANGKIKKITNQLLKSKMNFTLICLTGKNEKLYDYYSKKQIPDNINLVKVKFTKNIAEYYKASNLFVTRGGPLTILDSVVMHTPFIIDFLASPLDLGTKRFFVDREKCGEYITSPKKIKKRVEYYMTHPKELSKLEEATHKYSKDSKGASQIADIILQEALKK